MSEETVTLPEITTLLQKQFGEAIQDTHQYRGDETVIVAAKSLVDVCTFLRDDPRCAFDYMSDLTAVDYLEQKKEPRFEVVYHLKSVSKGHRIRVKVRVAEEHCEVDSVHHLWKCVNWYERECYDMYGITFKGHPDLRRILMYEEFEGYPLRKDYPADKQQPLVDMFVVEERHNYERG